MSNSDIMPLRSAVKQLLDDFVENYHTNYELNDVYGSIRDNWCEMLSEEAGRCFESIKVKRLLEYGFDEAFALVRGFGMGGIPYDGFVSHLYYHVMDDLVCKEFGDIEDVVRTYIENNRCDFCGKIDPDTISGGACGECDEKHKDHKEYCDRSCMMCGDIQEVRILCDLCGMIAFCTNCGVCESCEEKHKDYESNYVKK